MATSAFDRDPDFAAKVYAIVRTIPAGKVMTYGQIAEQLGDPSAARDVGVAMSRAPAASGLPCHRVVNKTGSLAPPHAFGSPANQRALLEAEGITFLSDGRIDMLRHGWREHEQLTF